jgi:hypothetical protein
MPWIGQTSVLGGNGTPPPRRRPPQSVTESVTPWTGKDVDPSWGPVGSLLKAKDPELYKHILEQHESMLALERARSESVTQSVTRTCPGCGVAFTPARANHRYHSQACRQASYRKRAA